MSVQLQLVEEISASEEKQPTPFSHATYTNTKDAENSTPLPDDTGS